jgi:alanine racemase
MTFWRPTRAEIDLDAIRANCRALGALLPEATLHLAVVKANGYGHGDVEVARACLQAGVDRLGVALVEEGIGLREAGIEAPIVVLVELPAAAAKEVVAYGLTPSVYTMPGTDAVNEAARAAGLRHPVHVAVDTGMHREGAPLEESAALIAYAASRPHLAVEGVWSHLAVADEEGNPATRRQIERFAELCEALKRGGIDIPIRHLANSAGLIAHPETHWDMVRAGIATYGLYPGDWLRPRVDLRPAMRLVSEVGMVRRVRAGDPISYGLTYAPERDATIATVLLGYADGFARLLSNRGEVLIGGKRRRVAGRVTMDQVMADCGDDDVSVGDEVVLIGAQGAEEVTAGEVADRIGTIHYEVCCAVSARVPRVYAP